MIKPFFLILELNLDSESQSQLQSSKQIQENKEIWQKFEELLYISSFRTLPILFKPQLQFLDKHTDNKQMPKIVVNETASIMFEMKNHLRINLLLTDITLLWKFVDQSTTTSVSDESPKPFEVSNEGSSTINNQNIVECTTIKELTLASLETYKLRLSFNPLRSHGHLHILGLKYRMGLTSFPSDLNNSADFSTLYGKHVFELKGPRINNNTQAMRSVVYDTDNRLNFKIVNKTALMQIEMDNLPKSMICNQLERVKIYFINMSDEFPIGNIKIASNEIQTSRIFFHNSNNSEDNCGIDQDLMFDFEKKYFEFKKQSSQEKYQQNTNTNEASNQGSIIHSLGNVVLKPNEKYELDMWIRAPDVEGDKKLYFMFFYEDFSIYNNGNHQLSNLKPSPKRNSASTHSLK